MISDGVSLLDFAVSAGLLMLGLATVLSFIRLLLGPSLPDKVVALDQIAILMVGIIALFTIQSGEPAFLDAAIVLALIAFLSTVTFARYIERRS